jgi:MFS family permease
MIKPAPTNGVRPKQKAPFKIMGLEATPDLLAIFLVYFVQGILSLSRLAVSYYFKDDLGMDPAELAVFTGLSTLPWLVKPLYGFASDTFPIWGYRRRSYLVLCGVLGSLAWTSMFLLHPSAPLATFLLILGSVGTACSDVVVDSIVVEDSRGQPASVAGAAIGPSAFSH